MIPYPAKIIFSWIPRLRVGACWDFSLSCHCTNHQLREVWSVKYTKYHKIKNADIVLIKHFTTLHQQDQKELLSAWLKLCASLNMCNILATSLVSRLSRGWLKLDALLTINFILLALLGLKLSRGWLKLPAPERETHFQLEASSCVVTYETTWWKLGVCYAIGTEQKTTSREGSTGKKTSSQNREDLTKL